MSIEEDLERALDVEPSSEFVARVRERIAQEPIPLAWWRSWHVVAASGVIAVLVLTVVVRDSGTDEMPPVMGRDIPPAASAEPLLPPEVPVVPDVSPVVPGPVVPSAPPQVAASAAAPAVQTAVGVQREVEALRRFVNMVRDGRYVAVETEDVGAGGLSALSVAVIDVEPLVVEPLAAIMPLEGGL